MTDNPNWQSPAGSEPQEPTSPWAAGPVPPAFPSQPINPYASTPPVNPYASAPPGAGAPPAWAPPPKPGLIPLRPLSFGTIIGSSFRVMRRNPAPTFGLAVLLYGFITIVYLAFLGAVIAFSINRISSVIGSSDESAIFAGTVGIVVLSSLVPIALAVIAAGLLQGIIALEVSRATLGEKLKVRGLWRLARGRLGALIGYTLLLTLVIVVFLLIAAGVTFLAFGGVGSAFANNSSSAVGAVLGAIAIMLLIAAVFVVIGAWIGTKLSLVPTAILLERLTIRAAIARSWSLTRGHFWRTLGTQLLISVIISTASSVVTTPISFIGGIATGLVNPNNDSAAAVVTTIALTVVIGILTTVVGAVGLVMQSAAYTLIYVDIRMRKEGLDLELLRYVEAKQSGVAGVENPYLPRTQPSEPAASGSPWA